MGFAITSCLINKSCNFTLAGGFACVQTNEAAKYELTLWKILRPGMVKTRVTGQGGFSSLGTMICPKIMEWGQEELHKFHYFPNKGNVRE